QRPQARSTSSLYCCAVPAGRFRPLTWPLASRQIGLVGEGDRRMDVTLQLVVGAVIGYLFGMLPTGMIVGRALGVDLTKTGSGRTGATNALRTLGVRWAVVVAIGDLLKGLIPVVLVGWLTRGAPWWGLPTWGQVAAASFAVLGHTFSPLIGFRGGRGIVTGG